MAYGTEDADNDGVEDAPPLEKGSLLQVSVYFYIPEEIVSVVKRVKFEEMFAVFHVNRGDTGVYEEVGRGNIYAAPARMQIQVEYFFSGKQKLLVQLYGRRVSAFSIGSKKDMDNWLFATSETYLGEAIRSGKNWKETALRLTPLFEGHVLKYAVKIKASEPTSEKEKGQFSCSATLPNLTNDPDNPLQLSCLFQKCEQNGKSFSLVSQSPVVQGTNEPVFLPMTVPIRMFIDDIFGTNSKLRISILQVASDTEESGIEKLKAEVADAVAESDPIDVLMLRKLNGANMSFRLKDPDEGTYNGEVNVSMVITSPPTFVDYLHKGLEMNFVVAIDFTTNNGDISDPSCLHFLKDDNKNMYTAAIKTVGEIIQDYDSDKKYPVFGFGGQLEDGTVSNDFNCAFDDDEPLVNGLDGILDAYRSALSKVTLAGPTLLEPIIRLVSRLADVTKDQDNGHYFVLMILTAGNVQDLEEATRAVIDVAHIPISIVVVGVGDNDFSVIKELGEKGKLLNMDGNYCARDILSYVKFENNENMSEEMKAFYSKEFASDVMFEIPDHVVTYMTMPPREPQEEDIGET